MWLKLSSLKKNFKISSTKPCSNHKANTYQRYIAGKEEGVRAFCCCLSVKWPSQACACLFVLTVRFIHWTLEPQLVAWFLKVVNKFFCMCVGGGAAYWRQWVSGNLEDWCWRKQNVLQAHKVIEVCLSVGLQRAL